MSLEHSFFYNLVLFTKHTSKNMGQTQSFYQQKLAQYRAARGCGSCSQRKHRMMAMPPRFVYHHQNVGATYASPMPTNSGTRGPYSDYNICLEACDDDFNNCHFQTDDCEQIRINCKAVCTQDVPI